MIATGDEIEQHVPPEHPVDPDEKVEDEGMPPGRRHMPRLDGNHGPTSPGVGKSQSPSIRPDRITARRIPGCIARCTTREALCSGAAHTWVAIRVSTVPTALAMNAPVSTQRIMPSRMALKWP